MKKTLALIMAVLMVLGVCGAIADTGYEEIDYESSAICICTNASIREAPNTSAKRYGQLHNGDVCKIIGEEGQWAIIDLTSTGLPDVPKDGIGYALKRLFKRSPYWIVLTNYTDVYADPWYSGQSNGALVENTPLLVISENKDFYCTRLKNGQAGVTFVKKSDVGYYTSDYTSSYAVVAKGPISVYSDDWHELGTLKALDIVQVYSWLDDYSYIHIEIKGETLEGWVDTNCIQPVIN